MAVSASVAYAARKATQQAGGGEESGHVDDNMQHSGNRADPFTTTALGRWSLLDRKLPPVESIRHLHVYDFDNTLFKTPMPNSKIWSNPTIGFLCSQDLTTGGWWHDSRILAATGEGTAKEEARAWEGWWNEVVVDLARLTQAQPDALCLLLTGRSESGYGDLLKRMVTSKGLDFDMVVLKPAAGPNNEQFTSTMAFKQAFLETLMDTYIDAREIRIYEDRPRHVRGFRDFLAQYNQRRLQKQRPAGKGPPEAIVGEVVPVIDPPRTLDPVVEVAEVQHMINSHNAAVTSGSGRRGRLAMNKTVFFTGYLIKEVDSKRLLSLLNLPANVSRRDVRFHANSILICKQACSAHLLKKVGGMGSKMTWEVEATGSVENSVWAAKVRPVQSAATIHTDGPRPIVVLAVGRGARPQFANRIQHWQPVPRDKTYVFETTIGEKALLRVEPENGSENGPEARRRRQDDNGADNSSNEDGDGDGDGGGHNGRPTGPRPFKRKAGAGSTPTQPAAFPAAYGRGYHAGRGGRGGAARGQGYGTGRGGYRGGSQRGRGGPKQSGRPHPQQNGHHFYQSLDNAGGGNGTGASAPMAYDDGAM